MDNHPAIEVRNLTRDFGKFRAVDNISFSVARGEIFGFLGPNGAGKSTTIRMLCCLLLPTAGEGWVDGLNIVRDHDRIKARIGYMSQRFSLYEDLTAEENLTFFGGVYGLPPARLQTRLEEVLTLVDLTDRRWDLIYAMADRGVTVLVTTHYMDEAEFCDRLVLIYQGRVIAEGHPRDLKEALPETILAVYPDRLGDALEVARNLPQVAEAAVFGDGLHVAALRPEEAEAALEQALAQAGIGVRSLTRITPSLEDAFISLIQRAGGA